jgi:hypothetical protein
LTGIGSPAGNAEGIDRGYPWDWCREIDPTGPS